MGVDDALQRIALGQAVLDQVGAREAAPGLGRQAGQQAEFGQRQGQRQGAALVVVDHGAVRLGVDLDGAHADGRGRRVLACLGAAQHGAHAGHDLGRIEWLDHVVVGAQAQGQQLVHIIGQGRDHDHGRLAVIADGAQHVDAVHAGKVDVQQHQVGPQQAEQLQRLLAVRGHARTQPVPLEIGRQDAGDGGLVFDDEHEGGGCRWLCCGVHGKAGRARRTLWCDALRAAAPPYWLHEVCNRAQGWRCSFPADPSAAIGSSS